MEKQVQYKVTIERITTELITNRTEFHNLGKDAEGDDNYEYVPAPDKVESKTVVMYSQLLDTIDPLKVIAAFNDTTWTEE